MIDQVDTENTDMGTYLGRIGARLAYVELLFMLSCVISALIIQGLLAR